MNIASEAENFPFIVKISSIAKKMKEVFSIALSLTTLNTIVSKCSEIEKGYLRYGPLFSKERKSLKTSPLEELETILAAWFKQTRTASTSIDGPHLKEKALHVADHLGIEVSAVFRLQMAGSKVLRKDTIWCTRLCREKVPL